MGGLFHSSHRDRGYQAVMRIFKETNIGEGIRIGLLPHAFKNRTEIKKSVNS
jgi:hypothetical protein